MFSTAGLARIRARKPWSVILAWSLLLVLSVVVAATSLGDAFTSESDFTNHPESTRAAVLLKERLYGGADEPVTETIIVRSETLTVDDLAYQQVVERTANELRAHLEMIAGVTTYYDALAAGDPTGAGLVSADRQTTLLSVTFAGDFDSASASTTDYLTVIEHHAADGFEVLTVGDLIRR